jgi:hypothetical protein
MKHISPYTLRTRAEIRINVEGRCPGPLWNVDQITQDQIGRAIQFPLEDLLDEIVYGLHMETDLHSYIKEAL